MESSLMMPSLFLCHGSPTLAIEKNVFTHFLNELAEQLPRPEAIVIFSAHWESHVTSYTDRSETYDTIHDFYGFPEILYQMTYPARGSRDVALQLSQALQQHGIPAQANPSRGLDHGAWVLLSLMYPHAEIPVIEVSVNPMLPPEAQYKIGQALGELRRRGILVIGSGATVHNLYLVEWENRGPNPTAWAAEFDDWLIQRIIDWDLKSLFNYEKLAPYVQMAIPRNEHFVPLFLAMGSADQGRKASLLHRSYDYGILSMIGFQFD